MATISPSDVANAANFLEQYLTDAFPAGDFTKGTALRDFTIGALASIFAYIENEATTIKQMQSLTSVEAATNGDATALRDAVVAIMSNFFVTPKTGSQARGVATGHATQQVDVFIQPAAKFYRTSDLVFTIDSDTALFIPASELIPIVDASNTVLEYQFRIPLVAIRTGVEYNIDPGQFVNFDRFNPYVTRVENLTTFSGGQGVETTAELLARAPTAISVRNLINSRSINAVLLETFPTIRSLFVAGMGDPEMQRDVISVGSTTMHVGGCADIYPLTDLVETTFSGLVGERYARPDGVITMFRDSVGGTFPGTIYPGDILRVTSGIPGAPAVYKIVENLTTELVVSNEVPFSIATDEQVPAGAAGYTIGRISPQFSDLLSNVGGTPITTGVTSRYVAKEGRVTLPGGPVMEIIDVAITNPDPGEAAFIDPADGAVHFPIQVNTTPSESATPLDGLQYQVIIHNPTYAQSQKMWMEIVVGTDTNPTRFDGYNLRVRYTTATAIASIDEFVSETTERTVAASQLVRAHNPVVLTIALTYKLKNTAPALLSNDAIAQTIVDYINAFDTTVTPLDTSAIIDVVRTAYPTIGAVLPFGITYTLLAPTGDAATYLTYDQVTVDNDKQVAGPTLDAAGLLALGITSRTLRYLASAETITATQVF
jgi:hypothetical protein